MKFVHIKYLSEILIIVISLGYFSDTMAQGNLVVNFSGMTPHLNQTLYLRVIDLSTRKEVGRTSQQIIASGFNVIMPVIEAGKSYFVDFFSDHNSNGLYDPPPVDHAWRLQLNNAGGGDTLNFAHNASFTDIQWRYMLTVNFTGMSPHIGQMLELKTINNSTNEEVGRIKVAAIPSSNFQIQLPGLQIGPEYKVQFYVDFNNNGLYDAPPADHAWEISFTNNTGDVTLNFSHNASFVDINWKYLLTVNLVSMNPHIGQKFELRVVRQDNLIEIGRISLPQILVQNFSVFIPGIELGKDYNIDFYADHNGNGFYDPPPTDHAWRLTFSSSNGDFVSNFTHNTNFTDIQWPGATTVGDNTKVPSGFSLEQNYPNPFNPTTKVSWQSPVSSWQTLKVYDLLGNEVATLVDEYKEAGFYEISFDASGLSSGIYFYKLEIKGDKSFYTDMKKMILMK